MEPGEEGCGEQQGLSTGVGSLSEAGEKKIPARETENEPRREQEIVVSWGDQLRQALLMGKSGEDQDLGH